MASHLENRVAMATRLADYLHANLPADIDLDGRLNIDWARVAELAGESHVPSLETQAAVITGLRQRRQPATPGLHLLVGLPQ